MCVGRVGGAHTRLGMHNVAHTEGTCTHFRSLVISRGGARASHRCEGCEPFIERNANMPFFLPRVHTQGGLQPPQESCYLRGVRRLAPACSKALVY